MIKVTDRNRDEIIHKYCERLLDDMDSETLYQFAYDMLIEKKDLMDNISLENEIVDYYPDMLEN